MQVEQLALSKHSLEEEVVRVESLHTQQSEHQQSLASKCTSYEEQLGNLKFVAVWELTQWHEKSNVIHDLYKMQYASCMY